MKNRCTNPNADNYIRYGGRGISFDPRWQVFENFLFDMGDKPEGMTLDRKDNAGNYNKGNCKWSTTKEQQRNRRANVMVEFHGKTQCLAAWSEETGIGASVIRYRLAHGWSVETALTKVPA